MAHTESQDNVSQIKRNISFGIGMNQNEEQTPKKLDIHKKWLQWWQNEKEQSQKPLTKIFAFEYI